MNNNIEQASQQNQQNNKRIIQSQIKQQQQKQIPIQPLTIAITQTQTKPQIQQQKKQQQQKIQQQQQQQLPTYIQQHLQQLQTKHKQLIQNIRNIQNQQVQQQLQQQLTQQLKQQNIQQIKNITKQIILNQKQQQIIKSIPSQQSISQSQSKQQLNLQKLQKYINKQFQSYTITQQHFNTRYNQLIQQANDSSWTDATQSQADDDQIWAVDDDIIRAMQQDSQQQINQQQQQHKQNTQQHNNNNKQQQIDYDQLQQQFITGQQSDHQILFGKHDKFCVSVNGINQQGLLVSGGGDDYMYMYRLPKNKDKIEEIDRNKQLSPYHIVKHSQTINKIQISYSKQYILTMTDNQILCTQIKTKQTNILKAKQKKQLKKDNKDKDKKQNKQQMKQQKKQTKTTTTKNKNNNKQQQQQSEQQQQQPICSDMVCHHLGDVVAISSGYQLQIYNIKGLKLYQTYYCQRMIDTIAFTQSGKQIVLACNDNKLRLLTPKTSQIITVGGVKQHQQQLTIIKTKGDIILSGDLNGYIGITSIKKSTLTTLIGSKQTQDVQGSINQLQFAGNYFIAGSIFDKIDWYDFGKAKKLLQSNIQGSASDICWQGQQYQYMYNVSTIKGNIYMFDCRNPLNYSAKTRAGNTIHKLWADGYNLAAACQDGNVRLFDVRKLLNS